MNYIWENEYLGDGLKEYVLNSVSLHPYFDLNFKGLKPKNYCGFLRAENENYFIIPKIANEKLQNLNIFIYQLLHAYDIKLSNEDLASLENKKFDIFELFIRLFSDKLLEELKKGVYKTYVTLEENLKVLRGKYIIEKNFANFYHQNIACEFDEFSMDNDLNRFFLYAIKTFMKYSDYMNLFRCEAILDEVYFQNSDYQRDSIHFDRMNQRYYKSYEIARMLLNKIVPMTTTDNNKKSFAFLFKMSEVFEKFIAKLCTEIDNTTKTQEQKNYGNLQLKPDITTDTKIIDTKYKLVKNKQDLKTHDKYQMFTYGINFDKKDTMLLYPKHLLDVDEHLILGEGENVVNLQMKSIDLNCNDVGYNQYIEVMSQRVRVLL